MARLPMPMQVVDLRFETDTRVAFTIAWDPLDPYVDLMDHIRVRFLLTNLLALGAADDVVEDLLEALPDSDVVAAIPHPGGVYTPNLVMHYIGETYTPIDGASGTFTNTFTNAALQQRFVRCTAQPRVVD